MRPFYSLFITLLILPGMLCATIAGAEQTVTIETTSNNPAIESRVKTLANELRCLVCQNQTLADSEADLAVDLRNEIRSMMVKGASDKQVIDYLVQRYGDFVMYRPPVKSSTLVLWFGPFILMILGGAMLFYYLRRLPARTNNTPLSMAEHEQLDAVLNQVKKDDKA